MITVDDGPLQTLNVLFLFKTTNIVQCFCFGYVYIYIKMSDSRDVS